MASKQDKDVDITFNVYVGSKTGVLKGVCFGAETTPLLKNLSTFEEGEKPTSISCLSWADDTQKELIVGFVDRTVKIYNTKLRAFTQGLQLELDDSPLVGLSKHESDYLMGLENGNVYLRNLLEPTATLDIQSGSQLSCIKRCPADPSIFATGGEENDLKIWNLRSENPTEPLFKARNVPHVLELRQTVWVQDLAFLPQTTDLVAICSRFGKLRLYDTKVDNTNRPVVNMAFCDHPLMSISATRNDRQMLVGSAQGVVGLIDIRNYGHEKIVSKFLGFNGSVRSIVADPSTPFFVSCGLDRHLYLHNLNERDPVKKLYLKSKLNCVAITKDFLAENPESEVKSAWQNIDMSILPGPGTLTVPKTSADCDLSSSPAKRIKRSKIE